MTDQPGMADQPGTTDQPAARTCPWCAAPARPDDTVCSACGAALAQRESIGDVRISGLTAVDPALVDLDKRPIHLRGPSPSQGVAPALIIGAVAGGPIGLAAIGGVAAVAGAEFLSTRTGGGSTVDLENLGKPSEVLLQALERERTADAIAADADASNTAPADPEAVDAAAADGGMSIWRDLPPVEAQPGDEGAV
jgi:hypothetical protein